MANQNSEDFRDQTVSRSHDGALLFVAIKLFHSPDQQLPNNWFPNVYGSTPLLGCWDTARAVRPLLPIPPKKHTACKQYKQYAMVLIEKGKHHKVSHHLLVFSSLRGLVIYPDSARTALVTVLYEFSDRHSTVCIRDANFGLVSARAKLANGLIQNLNTP